MMHDFADDVEELRQVAMTEFFAGPNFRRETRRPFAGRGEIIAGTGGTDAKRHVRVLGISDNEGARRGIRF